MIGTQALKLHPSFIPRAPPIDQAQSCYLLTGGMLRFGPLLTLREAAGPVSGLNKHPTDPSPPGRFPDTVIPVKLLGGVCSIQGSRCYIYIIDPYIDTICGRESS